MKHWRVKIAYGPWPVGHVFTNMAGNVGRTLAARGLVEEVEEDKAMAAPVDRMMRPANMIRKGKPK